MRERHRIGLAAGAAAGIGMTCGGLLLGSAVAAGAGMDTSATTGVWPWISLESLDPRLGALVQRGLDREPALMLAAGVAAAMPLISLTSALTRAVMRRIARRREADADPVTIARRSASAWIEVESATEPPLRLGELVRIGRGEECDLALRDAAVAETHALIQRTPDCEFVIFDVSAADGAGIAVNGERSRRRRLRDGDRIELGGSRVLFRMRRRELGERTAYA